MSTSYGNLSISPMVLVYMGSDAPKCEILRSRRHRRRRAARGGPMAPKLEVAKLRYGWLKLFPTGSLSIPDGFSTFKNRNQAMREPPKRCE